MIRSGLSNFLCFRGQLEESSYQSFCPYMNRFGRGGLRCLPIAGIAFWVVRGYFFTCLVAHGASSISIDKENCVYAPLATHHLLRFMYLTCCART